jgi:hypothetical protein
LKQENTRKYFTASTGGLNADGDQRLAAKTSNCNLVNGLCSQRCELMDDQYLPLSHGHSFTADIPGISH